MLEAIIAAENRRHVVLNNIDGLDHPMPPTKIISVAVIVQGTCVT